jgi:hypothetical protein
MYAQLEEDFGLARRSMSILDRATQVVADEDKSEVCLICAEFCDLLHIFFIDVHHLHCESDC